MTTPIIQTLNRVIFGADALDFKFDDEKLTITNNLIIQSDQYGIYSNKLDSDLVNGGNVISGSFVGVYFTGDNGRIINTARGLISGSASGVVMQGAGSQSFNNSGKVIGAEFYGVRFDANAQSVVMNNRGYIIGGDFGVINASQHDGGTLNNSGLIKSAMHGIEVSTASGLTTTIKNAAGGVINGTTDGIRADNGMFSLANHGKILGGIFDAAGLSDVVVNRGAIRGDVHLGGGNDTFKGIGGTSGPVYGDDGNDRLVGGRGIDQLHGGDGNDTLTGGPGGDRFFFDSALNPSTNVDRITDFMPGIDKIVLSEVDFSGIDTIGSHLTASCFHIGRHATTASQHIIYDAHTGFLFYDPDGNGAAAQIHFATISPHLGVHGADFLVAA
jgi:Ca2+-binding RTX toxin-like protein